MKKKYPNEWEKVRFRKFAYKIFNFTFIYYPLVATADKAFCLWILLLILWHPFVILNYLKHVYSKQGTFQKKEWFKQMIQTDDLVLQLATTGVWWQIDGFNILNCDF